MGESSRPGSVTPQGWRGKMRKWLLEPGTEMLVRQHCLTRAVITLHEPGPEKPHRKKDPDLTPAPQVQVPPVLNPTGNQRQGHPPKQCTEVNFQGHRAGQERQGSGPGWAKGRCLVRYHYRNLEKPHQGVSRLHQHHRWQHSVCKRQVSMLLPHPHSKAPGRIDSYRKGTALSSISKINSQMYLSTIYWAPIPWKTWYFTL